MELGPPGRGEHAEIVHVRRQSGRSRAVRQHDRPLPGRRADLQAVPLQGAHLGADAAPLVSPHDCARHQPRGAGEARPRDARAAARERGGQRVLARPTRTASPTRASTRRPLRADGEARRPCGSEVDWEEALEYVACGCAMSSSSRRREHRRPGVAARRRSKNCICSRASRAGSAAQLRFSPAPAATSRDDGERAAHPVARHAARRAASSSTACWWSARSCARTIR